MVNLGANLVAKTKVPLGIVPSGTGNDMARGLGIPAVFGVSGAPLARSASSSVAQMRLR